MGSPVARQIDGPGGAEPLRGKFAIVSKSQRPGIDVDFLFAQVPSEKPTVDVSPNCDNLLAAVGPFAILRTARTRMRGEVLVPHSVWSRR